ncbi:MAG: hypothetical protein JW955_06315 [Sedimentisphaerales bacterium]|nr:hypothetical protein [Sedimentisphaerales bacterium]
MAAGQKKVIAVVMALAAVSVVHADMVPVGQPHAGVTGMPLVCEEAPIQLAAGPAAHSYRTPDLDMTSVELMRTAHVEQIRQAAPLQVMAYEPGSLNLCLYALIGLGLCRTAPWVKRLSFGFIPEWYHDGGPYQIGHSHAIGPEFPCCAMIRCFVQPEYTGLDLLPQYYLGKVASLLHQLLFVPGRLASRGPPVHG